MKSGGTGLAEAASHWRSRMPAKTKRRSSRHTECRCRRRTARVRFLMAMSVGLFGTLACSAPAEGIDDETLDEQSMPLSGPISGFVTVSSATIEAGTLLEFNPNVS